MKEESASTSLSQIPVECCVFCDNDFSIEQYPLLISKAMYIKYQQK